MSPRKTKTPKLVIKSVRLSAEEWRTLARKRKGRERDSALIRRLLLTDDR